MRLICRLARNEKTPGLTLVGLSRCKTFNGLIIENWQMEHLVDRINNVDRAVLKNLYLRLIIRAQINGQNFPQGFRVL